jgi:hypothetical protein
MSEQHKPWDEGLLERLQRGNDRVAGTGRARFFQGAAIGVALALDVGHVTTWWLVGPLLAALLLVVVGPLLARVRARGKHG